MGPRTHQECSHLCICCLLFLEHFPAPLKIFTWLTLPHSDFIPNIPSPRESSSEHSHSRGAPPHHSVSWGQCLVFRTSALSEIMLFRCFFVVTNASIAASWKYDSCQSCCVIICVDYTPCLAQFLSKHITYRMNKWMNVHFNYFFL